MKPDPVYQRIDFPAAPGDRPYIFINMVTTIDGKIVTGNRNEPVQDLGSSVDHATMHLLHRFCDGLIIGAGTLRATPMIRVPQHVNRYVASASGNVDPSHPFLSAAPDRSYLVTSKAGCPGAELAAVRAGESEVDWKEALRIIRQDHGVERLLCEGGSELNAQLLGQDLVDELFWTVAPKVKLGADIPTYAGGEPLPRESVLQFDLLSCIPHENEIFLRYRRHR